MRFTELSLERETICTFCRQDVALLIIETFQNGTICSQRERDLSCYSRHKEYKIFLAELPLLNVDHHGCLSPYVQHRILKIKS